MTNQLIRLDPDDLNLVYNIAHVREQLNALSQLIAAKQDVIQLSEELLRERVKRKHGLDEDFSVDARNGVAIVEPREEQS